jgi:hypothetical protein
MASDDPVTVAARALMAEYRRCCAIGSLIGGQLAYSADGPGEWFTADANITGEPGVGSLEVRVGGWLGLGEARRLIQEAAASRDST